VNGGSDDGRPGVAHRHPWEAPWGPNRAAGGLLGVIGGEADGWADPGTSTRKWPLLRRRAVQPCGPVADALMDVARAYADRSGDGVPVDVAARHEGVAAPAWLLAVAVGGGPPPGPRAPPPGGGGRHAAIVAALHG
jgi:hypothetical protein